MQQAKSRILQIASIPLLAVAFLFLSSKTLTTRDGQAPRDTSAWKQKNLLITYCCSPPAQDQYFKMIAGDHFNLIPTSEEGLPLATKYNIKVLLQHGLFSTSTLHSPAKLKHLDALIKRVKDDPALDGYYIFDEPTEADFPELAKLVSHIKAQDPRHFCFINLLPLFGVKATTLKDPALAYRDYINSYIKQFKPDLLSYDYYNFLRNQKSPVGGLYFVHLRLIRDCAQKADIPFMNIIQASNFLERDWTLPTPAQLRWQVYTTLAYGGRGLSYFLYWGPKAHGGLYQDGKETPLADVVGELNQEMSALSPTLMSMDSLYVFQTAPFPPGAVGPPSDCPVQVTSPGEFVVGVFGEGDKEKAFMIVNRDYSKSVTAKVKVLGTEAIEEFQRRDGSWKCLSPDLEGEFSINLGPGDGKLFQF